MASGSQNMTSYKVKTIASQYTANGGQQPPNYFGTNTSGILMMNTTVNGNSQYKDWLIMDAYSGTDVGGGVAIGVNRQSLGAYIMRSAATRTAWAESAELLGTHNAYAYLDPRYVNVSGDTMTGALNLKADLNLYTGSADSPDITWWYADKGQEQARIFMGSGGTSTFAPNYRCYNSSGTQLYSGRLVIGDGTGITNAASFRDKLSTWALVSSSYNTFMPPDGTTNTWYKFGTADGYGILPAVTGGAENGHSYIGTSSWYWKYLYVDRAYTGKITIQQPAAHRDNGIVGEYNYQKAGAIWSMGASYQIEADGSGLGTLYGAAYGYAGQAYIGSNTYAGGHQFLWCENGTVKVALGQNIWTAGKVTAAGGFADHYNGSATKLAYSQSGLAASAISWLTCWNGYELRAISKAEVRNAVVSAGLYWANVAVSSSSSTTTTPSFGTCYSTDLRGANVRLVSDWVGFYQNANAGGSRYGYIECNANRMFFRKENSSSQNEYFDFGSRIYTPSISCGYTNTSYAMSTSSFICNSWIRTNGNAGWYSESYGGGWYMIDTTWVRTYNNKSVYTGSGMLRTDNVLQVGDPYTFQSTKDNHTCMCSRVNGAEAWHSALEIRERSLATTGVSAYTDSPRVGFHWGGRCAGTIGLESDNVIRVRNQGGGSYKSFQAGAVWGAVWNDYVEYRQGDSTEPGYCFKETDSGIMTKTTTRLEAGVKLSSDTFGFAIGQTKKAQTPISVSGRVLAYPYRDKTEYHLGDAVCSAPNGMVDIMTREEIMIYPERIVGTVSEIPTYDIWYAGGDSEQGNIPIPVNGRIWIYVR